MIMKINIIGGMKRSNDEVIGSSLLKTGLTPEQMENQLLKELRVLKKMGVTSWEQTSFEKMKISTLKQATEQIMIASIWARRIKEIRGYEGERLYNRVRQLEDNMNLWKYYVLKRDGRNDLSK